MKAPARNALDNKVQRRESAGNVSKREEVGSGKRIAARVIKIRFPRLFENFFSALEVACVDSRTFCLMRMVKLCYKV